MAPQIEDDELTRVHVGDVEAVCGGVDALVIKPHRGSGKRDVLTPLERRGAGRRRRGARRSKDQQADADGERVPIHAGAMVLGYLPEEERGLPGRSNRYASS